jgi:hypothetical protein
MQKRISYFDVEWNRQQRQGCVRITFDDREFEDLDQLSMDEMSLICNLLRAEKPVFWNPEAATLSTLADRVGS